LSIGFPKCLNHNKAARCTVKPGYIAFIGPDCPMPKRVKPSERVTPWELVKEFLSLHEPLVLIGQNVEDLLNFAGFTHQAFVEALGELGYVPSFALLKPNDFGQKSKFVEPRTWFVAIMCYRFHLEMDDAAKLGREIVDTILELKVPTPSPNKSLRYEPKSKYAKAELKRAQTLFRRKQGRPVQ